MTKPLAGPTGRETRWHHNAQPGAGPWTRQARLPADEVQDEILIGIDDEGAPRRPCGLQKRHEAIHIQRRVHRQGRSLCRPQIGGDSGLQLLLAQIRLVLTPAEPGSFDHKHVQRRRLGDVEQMPPHARLAPVKAKVAGV